MSLHVVMPLAHCGLIGTHDSIFFFFCSYPVGLLTGPNQFYYDNDIRAAEVALTDTVTSPSTTVKT